MDQNVAEPRGGMLRSEVRADHPWSAAVEQGCSTLPESGGRDESHPYPAATMRRPRMTGPVIPTQGNQGSTRCCPYLRDSGRHAVAPLPKAEGASPILDALN